MGRRPRLPRIQPVVSEVYDEVVFTDPLGGVFVLLLRHRMGECTWIIVASMEWNLHAIEQVRSGSRGTPKLMSIWLYQQRWQQRIGLVAHQLPAVRNLFEDAAASTLGKRKWTSRANYKRCPCRGPQNYRDKPCSGHTRERSLLSLVYHPAYFLAAATCATIARILFGRSPLLNF